MSQLDSLRRQAKTLKRAFAAGEAEARARVAAVFPDAQTLKHADALHVIAREEGHSSWPRLKLALDIAAMDRETRAERLKMALYFGQGWVVDRLLEADPDLAHANFGLSLALLDTEAVAARLAREPSAATTQVGVRSPILHLAFSQHWRHVPEGGARSVEIARMLHRHGADVNDSYPSQPDSEHRLSALYGALGHAGNLDLARWLLENGADPNDDESLYHATELGHADGLRLLLAHGARIEGTNALPRALDFDNLEMVELLLKAGADPNEGIAGHPSGQPNTVIPALHQAARRMCSPEIARVLIDHGANGAFRYDEHSAYAFARMSGNRPVAEVMEGAGQSTALDEVEAALAAIADGAVVPLDPERLTGRARKVVHWLLGFDGTLPHVQRLIESGYDPDWVDEQDMPAIHIAAWEGHADAVRYLLTLKPDLTHKNMYGGDLMGTVIHGAEFCPARARRDHISCARQILDAGSRLHRRDIDGSGVEELAEILNDWAEAHPDRVVEPS